MKNGKCPTRVQKKLIDKWGLNHANWLVTKSLINELHLVHRHLNQTKVLKKGVSYEI